ncbi:GNAT family N-acetyltransferase [Nocardia carnea]|uniref:GNAT family N-acetyltransferase n=1 Tax=Nocardia carnea TaxID=37328 RepID=UPI0024581CF6|nr:GNAT family N-acetyltransferase [Nocardia carnea]
MQTIRIAPADPYNADVAELLFTAIGGDRSRLTAATRHYRTDTATALITASIGETLVGVAGYETRADHIVLRHLATAASRRRRGIARRLLAELRARHPGLAVIAETADTALGFYLATGFTATSLGEKYPGVERFRLVLADAVGVSTS